MGIKNMFVFGNYLFSSSIYVIVLVLLIISCTKSKVDTDTSSGIIVEEPALPAPAPKEPPVQDISIEVSISQYDGIIKKYSRRYGFDWRLISAQIFAESSFRFDAVSSCGAVGLMQIMPSTSCWLGVDPDTLLDPEINISLGIYYDHKLYNSVGEMESEEDRLSTTMASFNAGHGRVRKVRKKVGNGVYDTFAWALPRETVVYVDRIWDRYSMYQ